MGLRDVYVQKVISYRVPDRMRPRIQVISEHMSARKTIARRTGRWAHKAGKVGLYIGMATGVVIGCTTAFFIGLAVTVVTLGGGAPLFVPIMYAGFYGGLYGGACGGYALAAAPTAVVTATGTTIVYTTVKTGAASDRTARSTGRAASRAWAPVRMAGGLSVNRVRDMSIAAARRVCPDSAPRSNTMALDATLPPMESDLTASVLSQSIFGERFAEDQSVQSSFDFKCPMVVRFEPDAPSKHGHIGVVLYGHQNQLLASILPGQWPQEGMFLMCVRERCADGSELLSLLLSERACADVGHIAVVLTGSVLPTPVGEKRKGASPSPVRGAVSMLPCTSEVYVPVEAELIESSDGEESYEVQEDANIVSQDVTRVDHAGGGFEPVSVRVDSSECGECGVYLLGVIKCGKADEAMQCALHRRPLVARNTLDATAAVSGCVIPPVLVHEKTTASVKVSAVVLESKSASEGEDEVSFAGLSANMAKYQLQDMPNDQLRACAVGLDRLQYVCGVHDFESPTSMNVSDAFAAMESAEDLALVITVDEKDIAAKEEQNACALYQVDMDIRAEEGMDHSDVLRVSGHQFPSGILLGHVSRRRGIGSFSRRRDDGLCSLMLDAMAFSTNDFAPEDIVKHTIGSSAPTRIRIQVISARGVIANESKRPIRFVAYLMKDGERKMKVRTSTCQLEKVNTMLDMTMAIELGNHADTAEILLACEQVYKLHDNVELATFAISLVTDRLPLHANILLEPSAGQKHDISLELRIRTE
eukprot:TRINITY_DN1955_c0_g1_i7.p1 TRINITY_DN1955_c0_g1~~TRINITY_DN1955_c0_g1_i7.p1  ORF type:complete len:865 (+),score=157.74 TRINITY_DN1955_c0_g1_i7:316-2595(+)